MALDGMPSGDQRIDVARMAAGMRERFGDLAIEVAEQQVGEAFDGARVTWELILNALRDDPIAL